MERIDDALAKFRSLKDEIDSHSSSIITETDTRTKIIDPILRSVLGFPEHEIFNEDFSAGKFIDYKLTVKGFARLMLEAKRTSVSFELGTRESGRAYKLNGAVFSGDEVKAGIKQVISYCSQKNAELACLTNGHEWVIFRGSRLCDGTDTLDGMAYVFTSLDQIAQNFKLFFDLLAYESISNFTYRAYFQEVEGRAIRAARDKKSVRAANSHKRLESSSLALDIDKIMTSFFRRLAGDSDPDLLAKCFVVTKESEHNELKLARISEDLITRIRSLNTDSSKQLSDMIRRVRDTRRNEFVILVGTKGAGKSTFIDRFFKLILNSELLSQTVVARVDIGAHRGSSEDILSWLDQTLLEALESAVFENRAPDWDEVVGMFFNEYKRWSESTMKNLYETDKARFKEEFGRHVERRREERPHEYIKQMLFHVVLGRSLVPCIVFDNADHFHIELQEKVFQYARSLYESCVCLVLLPITDRTSWQLSRQGALRSYESESLFLPTPKPKDVLTKRIEFFEDKILNETSSSGRGYLMGRGIHLSVENLTAFASALHAIFLRGGEVSSWIANLANGDIRQCLELAKIVVTSPYINVDNIFQTYVSGSNLHIPARVIKRALIRSAYDIYPANQHPFVHNIFCVESEVDSSPLMGLRLLTLLLDSANADENDPFVTIEQIINYFAGLQVEPSVTQAWLSSFLKRGLCSGYDPTVLDIAGVTRVEITKSGKQHYLWGTKDVEYVVAMAETTPLADLEVLNSMKAIQLRPCKDQSELNYGSLQLLSTFLEYLSDEDKVFVGTQDHQAFLSQNLLATKIRRMKEKIDDLCDASLGSSRRYQTKPFVKGNRRI